MAQPRNLFDIHHLESMKSNSSQNEALFSEKVTKANRYFCHFCKNLCSMEKDSYKLHCHDVHHIHIVGFCDLCCKSFTSESGFRQHKKIHRGLAAGCPKCDVCGKLFPASSHLKRHMKTHSNHKGFYCVVCGRSYKSEDSLKTHKC